ncbi:MAG: hypothetical protein LBE78_12965 [Burkholderiaceae bacterium]|jgi:hypothetical protein|nr:hypothetical protein [Burkholderiaceae bacterium]
MAAGTITATVEGVIQKFLQQIDFFRAKLNLPTERWDDIIGAAHDRAFIVAGAQKADLLNDLRQAVDKAVSGGSIGKFRQDFADAVARSGWTGWTGEGSADGVAWRTRVIYQTNLRTSYAAGFRRQLLDADMLKIAPYWRYMHSDSVLHPRPLHVAWHGLTLRHDHPFWVAHYPPNGWGCQCRVTPVTPAEYERGDYKEPPPGWDAIDPKTGAPVGIDKGWDYAPGAHADTPLQALIDDKLIKLDAPIGAAMYQALAPTLLREKTLAFGLFVDAALQSMWPRGQHMLVGALDPKWVAAAQRFGVTPQTAEVMVRDQDVIHTFRSVKTNQIPLDWYKRLPEHLLNPQAVVLDTTHKQPAYLLVYDVGPQAKKLVVQINYQVKKAGTFNVLDTGRVLDAAQVKTQLGHGYELVDGQL